ncbi:TBC1 domain family member 19 [Trichoplax sp. H2]|nr:TBC1 domain family member 19 [Trichoplax sp. H2]|eukprot:RDD43585.1 TBC1 domain family member 19 [Trichoplax sp. H2]
MAANNDDVSSQLALEFSQTSLNYKIQEAVQEYLVKPQVTSSNVFKSLQHYLTDLGWKNAIGNQVYTRLNRYTDSSFGVSESSTYKEKLTYIRKAQENWEKKIAKSFNTMCKQQSLELVKKIQHELDLCYNSNVDRYQNILIQRSKSDEWQIRADLDSLGKFDNSSVSMLDLNDSCGYHMHEFGNLQFIYSVKDFYEIVTSVRNPAIEDNLSFFNSHWGVMNLHFKVKELEDFKKQFKDLSTNVYHSSIKDRKYQNKTVRLEEERLKLGKKVVEKNHAPLSREFSKRGCPRSLRGQLWKQMLGVSLEEVDLYYYEQLVKHVCSYDMLVDKLIRKDIRLTSANDSHYFPFEDLFYQAMLAFTRDTAVLKHFNNSSATPSKAYQKGKSESPENLIIYPPNVAPICYLFEDCESIYFVLRELYTRFFFRLHTLSSHPQGILNLCVTFESLLQSHYPGLFYHLREIKAQPLKIAFKWMMFAFSGYLSPEDVLLLWDKIIAYYSLEVLSVLAVAIFAFRKDNLMQAQTLENVERIMADISQIQIIPLLQSYLFMGNL